MKLTLSLLVLSLATGCAFAPQAPTVEYVFVPETLSAPCEEPAGTAATNAAMAQWLLAHKAALRACNSRMAAIRAWGHDDN